MKYILISIIFLFISGCTTQHNQHLTIIQKNGKYGAINQDKQFVIKNIFEYIYPFNNGFAIVKNVNGKYGVIDTQNNLKLDTVYTQIGKFYNGKAIIQLDDKYGIIDNNYNIIKKPLFSYIEDFIYENSIYKMNKKFGCINQDGHIKSNPIYTSIIRKTTYILVQKDNKWGIMDNNCNIKIPTLYEQIEIIDNDLIKVRKDNKSFILNDDGKAIEF